MLVFVDESGDAGMTGKEGQTPFFAVALVLFEEHDQAERADRRIDSLRGELRLPDSFEFRFHHSKPFVREAFLTRMMAYTWFYLGIVIRKNRLWSSTFANPDRFYNYATSLVFENAKPYLKDAIVVIDSSGGRTFRRELSTYLQRKINPRGGFIKKIKHQDSAKNNLIQMADMVSGSVYRSMLAGKKDRWFYRNIIRPNELRVQIWPK
jgi:hypothetical protein